MVADAILDALRTGTFHVFPDAMARQVRDACQRFAADALETDLVGA